MRKLSEPVTAVLSRTMKVGFGVQIVLGIVWMCCAFAKLQGFAEGMICAGHLLLAFSAAFFFLGCLGVDKGIEILFGSLSIVTFPMLMQCHMTTGTQSPASSLLLLETSCMLRARKEPERKYAWRIGLVCWFAAGLFRGEFLLIGAVPVAVLLAERFKSGGKDRRIWYQALLAAAVAGLTAGLGSFYQEKPDLEICMTSRFAWTTLVENHDNWPQECRDCMDAWIVEQCSYEADGIRQVMAPYLEKRMDEREIRNFMRKISLTALRKKTPRIIKDMGWDIFGYALSPVLVPLQLTGKGYDSYTGINYRELLQPAPMTGKRYLNYGCWWFQTALVLAGLLYLLQRRSVSRGAVLTVILPACLMILLYTVRGAGQMDYKNTGYVMCVWLALILAVAFRGDRA